MLSDYAPDLIGIILECESHDVFTVEFKLRKELTANGLVFTVVKIEPFGSLYYLDSEVVYRKKDF